LIKINNSGNKKWRIRAEDGEGTQERDMVIHEEMGMRVLEKGLVERKLKVWRNK